MFIICHPWTWTNSETSFDGRFIGYGSSDLTIGVLDANSLSVFNSPLSYSRTQTEKILQWLFTILKAHDFPPTTLKFNPTGTLLVSGSADNTVRIVSVGQHAAGSFSKSLQLLTDSVNIKFCKAWKFIFIVLLAILVAVLALFAKQYIDAGSLKW